MRAFKSSHADMGSGTRAFDQALEKTDGKIKWMKRNYHVIENWLKTVTSHTTQSSKTPLKDVRLPRSLMPESYDIEIFPDIYGPDPETFTFSGSMSVLLNCTADTNKIILHINLLQVAENNISVVDSETNNHVGIHGVTYDADRQFIIIRTNTNLTSGRQYKLNIREFSGPLKDDLEGLYLSTYKRDNKTM